MRGFPAEHVTPTSCWQTCEAEGSFPVKSVSSPRTTAWKVDCNAVCAAVAVNVACPVKVCPRATVQTVAVQNGDETAVGGAPDGQFDQKANEPLTARRTMRATQTDFIFQELAKIAENQLSQFGQEQSIYRGALLLCISSYLIILYC